MANHTVVPHHRAGFGRGVDHRAVLDRRAGTNRDRAVIASEHCTGPHGGFWANGDCADDHEAVN